MTDMATEISASWDSLMREFGIITHNMANVSTAGFKRRCNSFTQALEAQGGEAGETGESPEVFDFSQGTLIPTSRTLDLALHGRGFFVVESPEGPLYTRHGIFHTNQNGQIVDTAGRMVAGIAGPLLVPSSVDVSEIYVGTDGRVSAGGASIGQLRIVDFPDQEDQLMPAGGNCFRVPPEVQPVDTTDVTVKQGHKEGSNVKLVDEMVNLILVSRMYDATMKVLNASKDTTTSALSVAMA